MYSVPCDNDKSCKYICYLIYIYNIFFPSVNYHKNHSFNHIIKSNHSINHSIKGNLSFNHFTREQSQDVL